MSVMADKQTPRRPVADDWDGEPTPVVLDIQVEDRPTIVLLANGRSWRRRIGFSPETSRRDG
jgi:hypothetical protein